MLRWVVSNEEVAKKFHYFTDYVTAIKNTSTDSETKLSTFMNHFSVGNTILRDICIQTRQLLDPKNPFLSLGHGAVFCYNRSEVFTSKGEPIDDYTTTYNMVVQADRIQEVNV